MLSQGVVDMVASLTRERDAYKAKAEALRELLETLVYGYDQGEIDASWWDKARVALKGKL